MNLSISVEDKRQFITWFLAHHDIKTRESVWLLNYLISNDKILDCVHFVERAHYCPRAIIIATEELVDFQYYTGGLHIQDAEKAFHDVRLHDGAIYMEIKMPQAMTNPYYVAVLETHHYGPEEPKKHYGAAEEAAALALDYSVKQLLVALDEALDHGDKERFLQLSKQYEQLKS